MRAEYDFSNAVKNPHVSAEEGKTAITIRLDNRTITYFKTLSAENGLPYQLLINAYLADCVSRNLKPETVWKQPS